MKNVQVQERTQEFYNDYWPQNVPDYHKTREHVLEIVPPGKYEKAFDGGCGTGVCSIALADLAEEVVGYDLSPGSLRTAQKLARQTGKSNIQFKQGSLLNISFPDNSFDLVFSWGVIHHTIDPEKALDELVRILKPGGTLVLAIYLKTRLTFIHEAIRHVCLRTPRSWRKPILGTFTVMTKVAEKFGFTPRSREDVLRIESLVEDWYFVPEKHFYTIREMRAMFRERGLSYKVVSPQTGRFRSTSNFIVTGKLRCPAQ